MIVVRKMYKIHLIPDRDSDQSSQQNSSILYNTPFEQNFRVTIYLPKNQLYVSNAYYYNTKDKNLSSIRTKGLRNQGLYYTFIMYIIFFIFRLNV